jgi:hypothetical protein
MPETALEYARAAAWLRANGLDGTKLLAVVERACERAQEREGR